ncbi:MAG: hypothetical protein ACRCX2_13590 [Paraclostridium sp.]
MKKVLAGVLGKLRNSGKMLNESFMFIKLLLLDALGLNSDTLIDEVDLVFNIINNIKTSKQKSELTYSKIFESETVEDNGVALETLCNSYTRFYRALEVLRISTLRYSHIYGINKAIFELESEIEALLYTNNRVLYNSIQRSTDLHENMVYDLIRSPILERFISNELSTNKHITKRDVNSILVSNII